MTKNNMNKLDLSAPWNIFYREVSCLFGQDPDVTINYDEDNYILKLYVNNLDKAEALARIMPIEKTYGNVTLKIEVVPPNLNDLKRSEYFEKAFKGNPVLSRVVHGYLPGGGELNFMLFEAEVAQYYADNLRDPDGFISTLYETIANDVFEGEDEVIFCTERK